MKLIPLTQGQVAIVDDRDYEKLSQWKWYAHRYDNRWYALRGEWDGQRMRTVRMHRVILNAEKGVQVDHKDHNGLNNQRANLRLASNSENQQNARPRVRAKSKFKGVHQIRNGSRWRAVIQLRGRLIHLGYYDTAREAALAYDQAAAERFGQFACTNFARDKISCA